jgi:hypothetical protein
VENKHGRKPTAAELAQRLHTSERSIAHHLRWLTRYLGKPAIGSVFERDSNGGLTLTPAAKAACSGSR